jgi:hypothetical protein
MVKRGGEGGRDVTFRLRISHCIPTQVLAPKLFAGLPVGVAVSQGSPPAHPDKVAFTHCNVTGCVQSVSAPTTLPLLQACPARCTCGVTTRKAR